MRILYPTIILCVNLLGILSFAADLPVIHEIEPDEVLVENSKGPPVESIVLTKTVGTDPQVCATGNTLQVDVGQNVYYCFEITNQTDKTLDIHRIADSEVGDILNNFAFALAPATTVFVTAEQTIYSDVIGTATWTAEDVDTTTIYTSVDSTTVTVSPPLQLRKTVGTDPGACSLTDKIMVDPGTNVYHCFEIANLSQADFNVHDLVDSEVGTILNSFNFLLSPGSVVFVTAEQLVNSTVVGFATWTAYEEQTGMPFTASDFDTVYVPLPTPTPIAVADLQVGIAASPDLVGVGEDFIYTIDVSNPGPDPATEVVLEVQLPSTVFFLSATSGSTFSGGMLTYPLDTVSNPEVKTVTATVRVLSDINLCANAKVCGKPFDPDPKNNSAQTCTLATVSTFHPADINEDTEIDAKDQLELLKAWKMESEEP